MKHPVNIKSIVSSLSRTFSRRTPPAGPAAFRGLFDNFKQVLESNNRALETITELGEKLGGDYLFDIVYVRNAYATLRQHMASSLQTFNVLTRGRYPKLGETFGRIDSLIQQAIDEAPRAAAEPVLFLEDIPFGLVREVGGKSSQLAEVGNRLGLSVPDTFVITTTGFDEFVRYNELEGPIARLKDHAAPSNADLRDLRELILQGTIPPELGAAIGKAVDRFRTRVNNTSLSVRSSAEEEDGARSFAGQFRTVLNVPLDVKQVGQAYKKVIASLFDEKAVSYQVQQGYGVGKLKMAAACMVMIDAVSSGVIYSTEPGGDAQTMIVTAAWGLGESVVEGRTEADVYTVRKGREPELIRATYGRKGSMIRAGSAGGTEEVRTPDDLRDKPCLTKDQIGEIASAAIAIERYFGSPRDIEWAVDRTGKVFILQARPLTGQAGDEHAAPANSDGLAPSREHPIIVQNSGTAVQRGAGSGPVHIVKNPSDIESFPKGAVLVAPSDSSLFVRVMPQAAAIITERGSQTSHMAALARELRVPTIVGMPGAIELLKDRGHVTVVAADDNQSTVFSGIVPELAAKAGQNARQMENVYEFRRKRYLLRYISPLHLIDPLMDEFTPERCRTLHDILRFIHEQSVAELVESGREGNSRLKKQGTAVELLLPVPAGILVMDIGGGLDKVSAGRTVTVEEITSLPFKALIRGMIHPGAWHSEAVALSAQDFLSSMMRMPDITIDAGSSPGYNVAVVSREYVNMSIRFGYHYNMIDCYVSENARNNHLYFRFAGGATDLVKRSRRLELIAKILKEYGFNIKIKGDLLIARLAGLGKDDMEQVLDYTGRLISYARQLDAALHDDNDVDRHARDFLSGVYDIR